MQKKNFEEISLTVLEKKDSIPYDDIVRILHDAHKSLVEKGMNFGASRQNAQDIENRLSDDGKFIIAKIGDQIVGVGAVNTCILNHKWYGKGRVAKYDLLGVASEYKGRGISKIIDKKREEIGYSISDLIITDTSEHNDIVLDSYRRKGWIYVDYQSFVGTNYYSIVLARWKSGCPFTANKCRRILAIRKYVCKLCRRESGELRGIFQIVKKMIKK